MVRAVLLSVLFGIYVYIYYYVFVFVFLSSAVLKKGKGTWGVALRVQLYDEIEHVVCLSDGRQRLNSTRWFVLTMVVLVQQCDS